MKLVLFVPVKTIACITFWKRLDSKIEDRIRIHLWFTPMPPWATVIQSLGQSKARPVNQSILRPQNSAKRLLSVVLALLDRSDLARQ